MPKSTLFLFIAFSFAFLVSKAQLHDQYVKATILFSDGRSIPAMVLNDESKKLNYSVSIQDSSYKKNKQTYTASEIREINFENGKIFRQITFTPHGTIDTITVLGRLLVTGKINLFQVYQQGKLFLVAVKGDEVFPMQKDEFSTLDPEIKRHYYNSFLQNALSDAPDAILVKASRAEFNETDISRLILEYNKLFDPTSQIVKRKAEKKSFWLAGAEFKKTKNYPYGVLGFVNYRLYITDISRSTSLNVGLHFYNYQFKTTYSPILIVTSTRSIASLPVFVQQNLLNKKVRPYLFAGFNFSYIHTKADQPGYEDEKGFQRNYGGNIIGGAGIEVNILRNLMLKADYRYENVLHGFMGGVAVLF